MPPVVSYDATATQPLVVCSSGACGIAVVDEEASPAGVLVASIERIDAAYQHDAQASVLLLVFTRSRVVLVYRSLTKQGQFVPEARVNSSLPCLRR